MALRSEAVDIGSSVTLDFYATHAESRKRQVTKRRAAKQVFQSFFFLTGKVYDVYIYIHTYIYIYTYISLHMYSIYICCI